MVATAAAVLLISPAVSAVANISIKVWGSGIHPISLTAVPMAIAAVVMGALALLFEWGRPVNFNATSIAALLYMAIIGSAVTFTLYYWLLRHMTATRLALIAYTAPVVALILGAVFLDEPVTLRTVAGSLLVVVGVALTVRTPTKKPDPTP
jgi:drug/metabolite transporter (DMT)-like permease